MSAAPASGAPPTTKATTTDKNVESKDTKPAAALEEDDEFEDFPVESKSVPQADLNTCQIRQQGSC
jgi:26 proteasome complex subunit DSS1